MERKALENFQAEMFTLKNAQGMQLVLTNIGATILSLSLPDKNGEQVDVLLGYEDLSSYLTNKSTHGATVGRFANRIGNARFSLNGKTFHLDKNEGENTLHGGFNKYFTRIWQIASADVEKNAVTFSLHSADGDQGMPGAADIHVTFSLSEDNALRIDYKAVSDQDTLFSLTNHSYFNLEGHAAGSVLNHVLWLGCSSFTAIDKASIPTGEILKVEGSAFDFTSPKKIGQDIGAQEEQLLLADGYDHNFIIDNPGLNKPFAKVYAEKSGIQMDVYTDMPAVQLYTANKLGLDSGAKDGSEYRRRGGFCLETQNFPDSPNKENFPTALSNANALFETTTIFKFSVKE